MEKGMHNQQLKIASCDRQVRSNKQESNANGTPSKHTHTIINNIRNQSKTIKRERLMWFCWVWSCNFLDLLETCFPEAILRFRLFRQHQLLTPILISSGTCRRSMSTSRGDGGSSWPMISRRTSLQQYLICAGRAAMSSFRMAAVSRLLLKPLTLISISM